MNIEIDSFDGQIFSLICPQRSCAKCSSFFERKREWKRDLFKNITHFSRGKQEAGKTRA